MKVIGLEKTLLLIAMSFFLGRVAMAGTAFTKTHREEFGQLIADGVENEKQLRAELKQQVNVADVTDDVSAEAINGRRSMVIDLGTDNVVVPTSKELTAFHKKAATKKQSQEAVLERVSEEIRSLE